MKRTQMFFMVVQLPLDFFMLLLAAICAYYLRFSDWAIGLKPVLFQMSVGQFLDIILPIIFVWMFVFILSGLYSIDPNRKLGSDVIRIFIANLAGLAIVATFLMFTQQLFDSRFIAAAAWVFAVVYVFLGRLVIRGLKSLVYRAGIGLRNVLIIGDNDLTHQLKQELDKRPELGYKVIGTLPSFSLTDLKKYETELIDEIVLSAPHASQKQTLSLLDYCNQHQITFKYFADLFSTYATNIAVAPIAGVPIVEIKKTRLEGWWMVLKRIFDLIGSLILMVVTSPIMLLTALIIFFETGGPIIYKNERIGHSGRKFYLYKFRSMYQQDCTGEQYGESGKKALEKEAELIKKQSSRKGPIYKVENDPRITPFGRFIRRWSIDELPQFLNVFIGDMSMVGPRPHQPREVKGYTTGHMKVLSIPPGVTGLAQISGRSDLSYDEEANLDIFYIENWSLALDAIVFIKTPFILFKKRKAE
ncbi:sugar transferase [Candidatus Nomurabacteria bacterium]|nr:sugar transferase [Candidatus Nomurabacteria bacterium]